MNKEAKETEKKGKLPVYFFSADSVTSETNSICMPTSTIAASDSSARSGTIHMAISIDVCARVYCSYDTFDTISAAEWLPGQFWYLTRATMRHSHWRFELFHRVHQVSNGVPLFSPKTKTFVAYFCFLIITESGIYFFPQVIVQKRKLCLHWPLKSFH